MPHESVVLRDRVAGTPAGTKEPAQVAPLVGGTVTGPEQHAATVRENSKRVRDSIGFALAEKNIPRAPTWTLLVPQALDNIDEAALALAERADTLQRERDEEQREVEFLLSDPDMTSIKEWVEQARAEADRLREALSEIEDGTTPDRIGRYDLLRDWVHKVARAALAGPQTKEPHDFPADYTGWRPLP